MPASPPSVILLLLMSSQRSLVISKNTFWYLNMMSQSTHQWYFRKNVSSNRLEILTCMIQFFCWDLISVSLVFIYQDLHIYYIVFWLWVKIKIWTFVLRCGLTAFHPHINLSKYNTWEIPIPFPIHLNTLNRGTQHF